MSGGRLRLLLYTHAPTGGGAERVWTTLAGGLAARGHAVTLAYDRETNEPVRLDPAVRRLALGSDHAAGVRALSRHLARERPDVSLSALGVSNLKHALAALAAGRGRRAVLGFHGHPASEPGRLSRIGNGLAPLITRLTARSVYVSEGLRDHVVQRGASRGRAVCIHNPVDVAGAVPAADRAALEAREPIVLAVGRLAPAKDFCGLVSAFARVRPDARLLIVGDGTERAAIAAEVARLGLTERVTLAGHVDRPFALYGQAACFVSSSRAEAFGNAVVEALAHGLPVVSTDCDGPRAILDGGRYGALVPLGDEAALARAIDAALAARGEPGPRVARAEDFSVEAAVGRYEALCRAVLAEGSRA